MMDDGDDFFSLLYLFNCFYLNSQVFSLPVLSSVPQEKGNEWLCGAQLLCGVKLQQQENTNSLYPNTYFN